MDWFSSFRLHLLTTIHILAVKENVSLRLLELHVPAHVNLGTRSHLTCHWEMHPGDILYSVKWYKDGKEFFRHVPGNAEPEAHFPLPGVFVEKSKSAGSQIYLSAAECNTSGRYRCEVSSERPYFHTVSEHADLQVVVLPTQGPVLAGLQPKYRIGDLVHVNCTSSRSQPTQELSWYINGQPARPTAVTSPIYKMYDSHLSSTSLSLKFNITEDLMKQDTIKIKCLATLATIYWQSVEDNVDLYKSDTENLYSELKPWIHDQPANSRALNRDLSLASFSNRLMENTPWIIFIAASSLAVLI